MGGFGKPTLSVVIMVDHPMGEEIIITTITEITGTTIIATRTSRPSRTTGC